MVRIWDRNTNKVEVKIVRLEIPEGPIHSSLDILGVVIRIPELASELLESELRLFNVRLLASEGY
jgi:hypothetical protein